MKTIIVMGPQGSGKKTQAYKLIEELEAKGKKVLSIDAGEALRKFSRGEGSVRRRVKEALARGKIQPLFITTYVLGRELFEHNEEYDYLMLDGFPRTLRQAEVLDTVLEFLGAANDTQVCWIDVSHEESVKRLLKRGRSDDTRESIEQRLRWSDEGAQDILNFYTDSPEYALHMINGEQTPDEVHAEILEKIEI